MHIYLPIAEMSVNIFLLLTISCAVGVIAGMFGLGGNFILIPVLTFIGIPTNIALSSAINQTVASSFSTSLSYWQQNKIDFKVIPYLVFSSLIGSVLGTIMLAYLAEKDLTTTVIPISYCVILGYIGTASIISSIKAMKRSENNPEINATHKKARLISHLPLKVYFPQLQADISIIFLLLIGLISGIMVALVGLGTSFIILPLFLYYLNLPTKVAIGTSSLQLAITNASTTILHSIQMHSVDIVLSVILITGATAGAQAGIRISKKIAPEKLKLMFACVIFAVFTKLLLQLFIDPTNLYSIMISE